MTLFILDYLKIFIHLFIKKNYRRFILKFRRNLDTLTSYNAIMFSLILFLRHITSEIVVDQYRVTFLYLQEDQIL